MIYEHLV